MREVAHVLFGNVDALMRVVDKKRVGTRERDEFLKCDLKILFLCSLFLKIQILAVNHY